MALSEKIDQILATANISQPPNEAATCLWVIVPLLEATGYAKTEIVPVAPDAAGQYPDYTILPGTEFTWYLEAKSWSVNLSDQHATQSLNYANQNGKRWVVLTNGRRWRLYDNTVLGTAAEKLVCEVDSSSGAGFQGFLTALSRDSVTNNKLEQYATDYRLESVLTDELQQPGSDLTKALLKTLKQRSGLAQVKAERVVEFFKRQGNREEKPSGPPSPPSGAGDQGTEEPEGLPPAPATPPGILSLADIAQRITIEPSWSHKVRPLALEIDGTDATPAPTSWVGLVRALFKHCAAKIDMPSLPWPPVGPVYFNSEQAYRNGDMVPGGVAEADRLVLSGSPVYLIRNAVPARYYAQLAKAMCDLMGLPAESVKVRVEPY